MMNVGDVGPPMQPALRVETTETDEDSFYKTLQMFRRYGEILLLQWAWLKCWFDLVTNGMKWYDGMNLQQEDIKCFAPMVVIMLGIVTTNSLGFVHFQKQGSMTSACVAAVDLDTPYLAWKHSSEIVRGAPCPEWEKLRLRNSIWRSLPLAGISLVLSLRLLVEIPACQGVAIGSALTVGAFPHRQNDSYFARDLRRDGLDLADMNLVKKIRTAAGRIDPRAKAKLDENLTQNYLGFEGETWAAAHCSESMWQGAMLPRGQDVSQTWLTLFPPDMERVELGGIGSGNLASLNFVFSQEWWALLRQNEARLRPKVLHMLDRSGSSLLRRLLVKHTPWQFILDKAVSSVLDGEGDDVAQRTLQQTRPWRLDVGNTHLIHIKEGWKVKLFQHFALLLVAVLPILKRILTTCKVRQAMPLCIVTFYAFLDLTLVAVVWIWCAAAPLAYNMGEASKKAIAALLPFATEALDRMGALSREDFVKRSPGVMATLLQRNLPGILRILKEDMLPTLEWDWLFFLGLVAGCWLFLVLSTIVAWAFYGAGFLSSMSSGICGPLWLVSKETRSHGSTAPRMKRLYFVVISRSMLFAGFVTLVWWRVDHLSKKLFFAWISNYVVEIALLPYWLSLCAVHCVLGLFATYAVELSLALDTTFPDDLTSYTAMSVATSEGTAYGTFPKPAKQEV